MEKTQTNPFLVERDDWSCSSSCVPEMFESRNNGRRRRETRFGSNLLGNFCWLFSIPRVPCSQALHSHVCVRTCELSFGLLSSSSCSAAEEEEEKWTGEFEGLRFEGVTMELDPRQYEHLAINDDDVRGIVLSYLVHNCFKETAESFMSSSGVKLPGDYPVEMDKRKPIFHLALEGNALKAIELTEELAHNLLEENMDLHFDLLSLHFVELVCSRKCTEALEFAQTKLTPFGRVQKYVEKLEDFIALLAYEEPEKSPMFHLLSPEYRQNIADCLNRAILAHANMPSYSALERLIQQTTVVRQCLHQEGDKDAPQPFSLKAFLKS